MLKAQYSSVGRARKNVICIRLFQHFIYIFRLVISWSWVRVPLLSLFRIVSAFNNIIAFILYNPFTMVTSA